MGAMTIAPHTFAERLAAIVGPRGVLTGADAEPHLVDFLDRYHGQASSVVRPGSTDEVAAVVGLCAQAGVPIVTQGGNTGLCGGSIPADRGPAPVVVVLSRMNRIVDINIGRATATVEAGVTIENLQVAAAEHNLLFAPDWGARGTAQVGGGISTNAGGINVLRWGSMREQVLGLEVVLPDGRVWDGRRSLRKDATGIDLKQIFIGAEGTLGIVTGAVFRLHPLPTDHVSAFVALESLDGLMDFLALARSEAGGAVSAFELLPENGVGWVTDNVERARRPLTTRADWYVLIRLSGDATVTDQLVGVLDRATARGLVGDAAVAVGADQEANLWFIRDELATARRFGPRVAAHKFDMAVPVDRVVPFLRESARLLDEMVPGTLIYAFGHVGDGNLHYSFYPGPDTDLDLFQRRSPAQVEAIDELTWANGGTVSAEHGVGQEMLDRVEQQKPAIELELTRRIKDALDPSGIMNPGKVYPIVG